MKQSDVFLQGEGQAWHERNKDKLPPKHDPVMEIIEKAGIIPQHVLEIGCGSGWRLDSLFTKYGCNTYGVDPSTHDPTRTITRGTADNLPFIYSGVFDLVIYGFCLYLVDREDLFKVVTEGDRVLQDGGYLVIHDFHSIIPFKRKYKYRDDIFSYHMNYHNLWLANPSYGLYNVLVNNLDDEISVVMLKKDITKGWPLHD